MFISGGRTGVSARGVFLTMSDLVLGRLLASSNHLLNMGCTSGDLGCLALCLWLFEDRELVYSIM
jgi:NADH:ubiquinone oxidoreductase subunit D